MKAIERVLAALTHREADRVPVFLLFTMHGAIELGLTIEDYFSRADQVVEGQRRLRQRFGHDCYFAFTHAAAEHEAWGGEVVYSVDGPPNAGAPVIRTREDIFRLKTPDLADCPAVLRGIEVTRGLAQLAAGEAPVIAAAISPFSPPVMLMGFPAYLDLLHDDPEAFARLMQVTRRWSNALINAHFAAGATAVAYFDPLSATNVIESGLYGRTGLPIAREMIPTFPGAIALHLASGSAHNRVDLYASAGAAAIGIGSADDLVVIKQQAAGRISLIGGLNGMAMASEPPEKTADRTRSCIEAAAAGGGFILADGHGEIPFQVPYAAVEAVMETARTVGRYPLESIRS